jgi:ribulose-phosphate 3-epimerase
MLPIRISPSILSADFGNLNAEIALVEPFVNRLHVDVMDGHFVPNITIGALVVRCIKSKLPIDCHLMITDPEKYYLEFIQAGASSITFHIETVDKPAKLISKIKAENCLAGVSLKPKTPVQLIKDYVADLDIVLVMTVEPGFGGQKFMEEILPKITELRQLKPNLSIHVDGGINADTGRKCVEAGADTLITGSYLFGAEDRRGAIAKLRGEG